MIMSQDEPTENIRKSKVPSTFCLSHSSGFNQTGLLAVYRLNAASMEAWRLVIGVTGSIRCVSACESPTYRAACSSSSSSFSLV